MTQRQSSTPQVDGSSPLSGRDGSEDNQRGGYRYTAYSASREITQGVIKAASSSDAREVLIRSGLQPLAVRRVRPSIFQMELLGSKGVKPQEVLTLTEQMAVLLKAGVPLVSTMEALYQQCENSKLKEALEAIAGDVRGGLPLSQAMAKYPKIFSNFYTQMITLGETSGDLEGILEQTALYQGREQNLRQTIKRALTYPLLVIGLAAITTVIMVVFVLPKILELFSVLDVPLPLITRIVLGISSFIIGNQLNLGLAIMVATLALFLAWRRPVTRTYMHRGLLKVPVIKHIIVYRELGRFSRLTSLMLHNGLPLTSILGMVAGVAGNLEIKRVILESQAKVAAGETLSSGLGEAPFIPPMFVNLIRVGDISGNLEGNLTSIANFYDRELDAIIASSLAMLEPILTMLVGGIIALVALTIIVPIYSLIGNAGA